MDNLLLEYGGLAASEFSLTQNSATFNPFPLVQQEESSGGFRFPFFGTQDSDGMRNFSMNIGEWFHSIYTGFPGWWQGVIEDLRRADVRTFTFGMRMNIGG